MQLIITRRWNYIVSKPQAVRTNARARIENKHQEIKRRGFKTASGKNKRAGRLLKSKKSPELRMGFKTASGKNKRAGFSRRG